LKLRSSRLDAALIALALAGVTKASSAAEKRPLPDYDGRGAPPTTTGDVLLWVPRVLLAPPYLVSEYVIRRPLGWAIAGAERAGLPAAVYEFLTFGPDHNAGVLPTALIDFGFRPSVGLYGFWNAAGARGNDLRLQVGTWGVHWLAASLADRIHLSRDPFDLVRFEVSGIHRPDYAFFGLGPNTRQSALSRYGSDRFEARILFDRRIWRLSAVHAGVTAREVEFHRGRYDDDEDPVLDDQIASGNIAAPPGYPRGYTMVKSELGLSVDSRRAEDGPRSGVRAEAHGAHSSDVRVGGRGWVTDGGTLGAFVDLNHRARVLSLLGTAQFVDPLGSEPIPFTELAQLGGFGPMRGLYPGRLFDRSAVVAELAYQWPIWIWLDGSMRFEMGNVFGEHLRDFDFSLLRMSAAIGLESVGSPDRSLEVLFGVGSETIASGARIDSFRLVVGSHRGF
jgi:hypothetical protein